MLLIPLARLLQQVCGAQDACETAVHARTPNCLQQLASWSVAHCTEISALTPIVVYRSVIKFSLSNGNKVNARSYGRQHKQSVPYSIPSVHYSASGNIYFPSLFCTCPMRDSKFLDCKSR